MKNVCTVIIILTCQWLELDLKILVWDGCNYYYTFVGTRTI